MLEGLEIYFEAELGSLQCKADGPLLISMTN